MRCLSRAFVAFLCFVFVSIARADLRSFVEKPDKSFAYKVETTQDVGGAQVLTLQLTSQTWRGLVWTHWVTLVVPAKVTHPDKAILYIQGGSTKSPYIDGRSQTGKLLITMANQTGAMMVALQQVPNQPLFGDKYEDALIAMTFAKYLETKEQDWPLLLPMVKSAVRAMDAVQAVAKDKLNQDIKQFIVTGASKRGWTTWLTAATDPRVIAIAPMVIDVLNFGPQLKHQEQSYGRLSEQVKDYDELQLHRQLDTPQGQKLTQIVDPYSYLDKLALPKLILLGTNDPYWTVDASSHYFPQLKGTKSLYYEPNAGHGLGAGIGPTLVAFLNASLAGKTLPELSWSRLAVGELKVQWKQKGAVPWLWQAESPTRDFRRAKWTRTALTGEGETVVKVDKPQAGWTAFYVDVRFPAEQGLPFGLSTEMTVIPDTFPSHPTPGKPSK